MVTGCAGHVRSEALPCPGLVCALQKPQDSAAVGRGREPWGMDSVLSKALTTPSRAASSHQEFLSGCVLPLDKCGTPGIITRPCVRCGDSRRSLRKSMLEASSPGDGNRGLTGDTLESERAAGSDHLPCSKRGRGLCATRSSRAASALRSEARPHVQQPRDVGAH